MLIGLLAADGFGLDVLKFRVMVATSRFIVIFALPVGGVPLIGCRMVQVGRVYVPSDFFWRYVGVRLLMLVAMTSIPGFAMGYPSVSSFEEILE